MERIGSHNAYRELIHQGSRIQSQLFAQQRQLATSNRAEHFDEMPSSTQLLHSLQNIAIKADGYIQSGKSKLAELENTHTALKNIADLLIRAQTTASTAMGAATGDSQFDGINHTAETLLDELQGLLNCKHDGGFLLSGCASNCQPVKIRHGAFAPQKAPSSPDSAYYCGNTQSKFIAVSDTVQLENTLNAKDPAIEKAIRAIAMLTKVQPSERDTAKEAFTLLKDAIRGVSGLQSVNADLTHAVKNGLRNNEADKLTTDTMLAKLTKVDAAQVMADMANLQVSLQASFTALSKMSRFNLLDYMR